MARTLTNPKNVVTSLKAWATGLLTQVTLIIPIAIAMFLNQNGRPAVAVLLGLLTVIGSLWVYGYYANKLWGWK